MFIPGWFFSALTFPGIVMHEFIVYLLCRTLKINVTISFFDFIFGGSTEIVQVSDDDYANKSTALRFIPILLCTLGCVFFAYLNRYTPRNSLIEFLVIWFSISMGVHGFPFKHAKSFWVLGLFGLELIYAVVLFLIVK